MDHSGDTEGWVILLSFSTFFLCSALIPILFGLIIELHNAQRIPPVMLFCHCYAAPQSGTPVEFFRFD